MLVAILLFGLVTAAVAQEHHQNFFTRVDSTFTARYYKTKYDTSYVARPKQRWLFRFLLNQTSNYIHARGTVKEVFSKYNLHTRRNTTIGLEVNYNDFGAAFSINPDKISGEYTDYEFNFEYHGNRISADFSYQRAESLAGNMELKDIHHMEEGALNMKVFNVTGYYTFNHRRFSFPAALYQNYYQIRSAGSWLAGLSFQGGRIRTTDELKIRTPQAPEVNLSVVHVGIGGGYAYNFALGKRKQWLLHLSALPTFVIFNHDILTVNGQETTAEPIRFNMIFNERAAVIFHFAPRCFAGASLMMSNSLFDDSAVTVNQNKLLARGFFGLRI